MLDFGFGSMIKEFGMPGHKACGSGILTDLRAFRGSRNPGISQDFRKDSDATRI